MDIQLKHIVSYLVVKQKTKLAKVIFEDERLRDEVDKLLKKDHLNQLHKTNQFKIGWFGCIKIECVVAYMCLQEHEKKIELTETVKKKVRERMALGQSIDDISKLEGKPWKVIRDFMNHEKNRNSHPLSTARKLMPLTPKQEEDAKLECQKYLLPCYNVKYQVKQMLGDLGKSNKH